MNTFARLWSLLEGKKTYIVGTLALLYLAACQFTGRAPDTQVLSLFGFLGLTFLRSAVARQASDPASVESVKSAPIPRIPSLLSLILVLLVCIFSTGCTTLIKSDKICTIKETVFGLKISTTTAASQTPEISFGQTRSVIHFVPTSTNILYAAPYADTYDIEAANPFHVIQSEDAAFGYVSIDGTNGTHALVPVPYRSYTPRGKVQPKAATPETNASPHLAPLAGYKDVTPASPPTTVAPDSVPSAPSVPSPKAN